MTGSAVVVHDPTLIEYDFGPSHPMQPVRVDLTLRLAEDLGVLRHIRQVPAAPVDRALLEKVHSPDYIEAVEKAGAFGRASLSHGLGTEDNPIFPGMHVVSSRIAGAAVEACRQVWSGEVDHAASLIGGLHHAMRSKASGFCIYNDPAVGIQWLLDNGCERIVYVDVDAHHGDGVERLFWNEPRVMTISLHETGQLLFPGTGFARDLGGPDAEGTAVNVALPPGTGDAGWLRAFHAVVPDLVREFKPTVLVTQQGCDSHTDDPLAHLALTVDCQRASYAALHDLAHEVTDGRWVAFGGGGYAVVEVVPRAWTHLLAIVAGHPVDPETPVPEGWRDYVLRQMGQVAPSRMTDGKTSKYTPWSAGYDPDRWLDQQIHQTRTAVFPLHGLDPMP